MLAKLELKLKCEKELMIINGDYYIHLKDW